MVRRYEFYVLFKPACNFVFIIRTKTTEVNRKYRPYVNSCSSLAGISSMSIFLSSLQETH